MKKSKILVSLLLVVVLSFSLVTTALAQGAYDSTETARNSRAVGLQIQAEGTVLLKNEAGALPLGQGAKVNVFGTGQYDPYLAGGGSGSIRTTTNTNFYDGLRLAGIDYNPALAEWYRVWNSRNSGDNNYRVAGEPAPDAGNTFGTSATMRTAPPFEQLFDPALAWRTTTGVDAFGRVLYGAADKTGNPAKPAATDPFWDNQWEKALQYTDEVAIIVMSRSGSESNDLSMKDLKIREQSELELLQQARKDYKSVIVIYNTCNVMEMSYLDEYADAALYTGAPGEVGFESVGRILTGEVNPSGRLVDTVAMTVEDHPSTANFGDFGYTLNGAKPVYTLGSNGYVLQNTAISPNSNTDNKFVQYQEGIYVGYRYFETFEKTDRVMYPFGYGLSYTTFEWTVGDLKESGDQLSVNVTVRNTGKAAGKDVVGVYMTAPYTQGGIEKAKNVLVGFEKTRMLSPGSAQTLTIAIDKYYMASYDMAKGRYIMEAGAYEFDVASSLRGVGKGVAENRKSFKKALNLAEKVWENDPVSGSKIENQFEDMLYGYGANEDPIPVLSRDPRDTFMPTWPKWETQYDPNNRINPFMMPVGYQESLDLYQPVPSVGPDPVWNQTPAGGIMKLADLYNAAKAKFDNFEYRTIEDALWDSPDWGAFIDQFTVPEAFIMAYCGGYRTAECDRLGVPGTDDCDGPQQIKGRNGFNQRRTGVNYSTMAGLGYPMPSLVACTWNKELAKQMGECVGMDAAAIGVNAWYGPAMNMHRNPMGGRNFEYYSEDPFISGKIGANVVEGSQSKGLIVAIKHFALNDCEISRRGIATWADEQTVREIYLRTFEMSVKEGGAKGIMSSYNRFGKICASSSIPLITNVLRGEWGFRGYVVTDGHVPKAPRYQHPLGALYAQNDTILSGQGVGYPSTIPAGHVTQYFAAYDAEYARDPIGVSNALKRIIKNLCYMKMFTLAFESPAFLVEANTFTASISAPEVWNADEGRLAYDISVGKVEEANLINVTAHFDGGRLEYAGCAAASGFAVLEEEFDGASGILTAKIALLQQGAVFSSEDFAKVLTVNFDAGPGVRFQDVIQGSLVSVVVTYPVTASQSSTTAFKPPSVFTMFDNYLRWALDPAKGLSDTDLSYIIYRFYLSTTASANWAEAKRYDTDGNGIIDLVDIMTILSYIK